MPVPHASPERSGRRHLLDGTAWGLLAEGLALPTGLATVVFLTRALGAADYGLYVLTVGFVLLLQAALSSLLTRATIKFVSEADDVDPVLTSVLRLHLAGGVALAAAVVLFAPALARVFGEPELTRLFRVFALSIPVEALAQAHIAGLIGLGRYRRRAWVRSTYWLSRLGLIVGLVVAGYGVEGAMVGAIGASLTALLVARRSIRPSLAGRALPASTILVFGFPLLLSGLCTLLQRRVDLFAFKAFGGNAEQAGHYGSAQNLAIIPEMLASAFAPLLLSSMAQALRDGRPEHVRTLASDFLRVPLLLVPIAAAGAGAASEITSFAYGPGFSPAGDYLRWLLFVGVSTLIGSTAASVLIVHDRTRTVLLLSSLGLATSVAAFPLLIPRYAGVGAAVSTLLGSLVSVICGLVIVQREWGIRLPLGTTLRAALLAPPAWIVASLGPTEGVPLVLKLTAIALGIGLAFAATGEFTREEIGAVASRLSKRLRNGARR